MFQPRRGNVRPRYSQKKEINSAYHRGVIRTRKLIFRNMFIREEDANIAKVLWNYFTAVALRWPIAWNQKQRGLILNRTTGYRALMQFLPIVILSLDLIDKVPAFRGRIREGES
jgi:hypothetical protein